MRALLTVNSFTITAVVDSKRIRVLISVNSVSATPVGALFGLVLLLCGRHPVLAIGYPSPCNGHVVPNDPGSGHGPDSGRPPTVAFLLTGGIPSSQPSLLGFQRTVGPTGSDT